MKNKKTISQNILRVDLKDESYDIIIGSGILKNAGKYISSVLSSKKICVVADEEVAKIYLIKFMRILEKAGFEMSPPIIVPSGENSKNFEQLQEIINKTLEYKLDRDSALLAFGGGVVGDITGFAASIIKRGIDFVQVPTTLLAQVDSSVGGKTAINTKYGKNLVGSFYQPKIVLIDIDVLKSLSVREIKSGYAEILKYALINNPDFFECLEQNGNDLINGNKEALIYAINISCTLKAEIVKKDSHEKKDIRAVLNLGHTFAHAIEAIGGYNGNCLHGEAVGIGIILAYEFSQENGFCTLKDVKKVKKHFSKMGLMTAPPFKVTAKEMINIMKGDKKNKNGEITLVLSRGIGKTFISHGVDEKEIKSFLKSKFG